jgi:hypothetical protein
MTPTTALGGLTRTEAESLPFPPQFPEMAFQYCAGYQDHWEFSDGALASDPDADANRTHDEALIAFATAAEASAAFRQLIAVTAPHVAEFQRIDAPTVGEERLVTQSHHSATIVRNPDGTEREEPDDADFTFLFRRGPVLAISDDDYSVDAADFSQALALAEALDSRIAAALS